METKDAGKKLSLSGPGVQRTVENIQQTATTMLEYSPVNFPGVQN